MERWNKQRRSEYTSKQHNMHMYMYIWSRDQTMSSIIINILGGLFLKGKCLFFLSVVFWKQNVQFDALENNKNQYYR